MTADHGESPDTGTAGGSEPPLDAAARLRMIDEQQQRARSGLEPDARLLYAAWGLAWGAGYLAMWFTSKDGGAPAAWAGWTLAALIVAAMVFTIVHSISRSSGTRGVSARAGAMYGWGWMLGFVTMWAVLNGMIRAGADGELVAIAANGVACLIVGLMYLAGGMVFQDPGLYGLGVWMLLTAAVATLVGLPGTNLVMALMGGGGFLVMGAATAVVAGRSRRQAGAHA